MALLKRELYRQVKGPKFWISQRTAQRSSLPPLFRIISNWPFPKAVKIGFAKWFGGAAR
jgi:hypothetical protein